MKAKQSGDDNLTWGDTKNMPVTSRVIQETLRVASVLSFTFREAVEDVEFDGKNQKTKLLLQKTVQIFKI